MRGQTIEVNGGNLYVEQHGSGDPLVLVHGGTLSSEMWTRTIALLEDRFQLVVFDARGHGRSTNPAGEQTYALMADDTAALIDCLQLERPVVGGWSDGGHVALEVGRRHPGVAHTLIAGGVMHRFQDAAYQASTRAYFCVSEDGGFDSATFEARSPEYVRYLRTIHTQTPDQWAKIIERTVAMWAGHPDITKEMLARVSTPTLVVCGDRDEVIPVRDAVDIFEWLPDAELAILPGANHSSVTMQPSLFASVVADYITRH